MSNTNAMEQAAQVATWLQSSLEGVGYSVQITEQEKGLQARVVVNERDVGELGQCWEQLKNGTLIQRLKADLLKEKEQEASQQHQEPYKPTAEEEAMYASMLTVRVITDIQQAYAIGRITDQQAFSTLLESAKQADTQVRKLADVLAEKKKEQ